MRQVITGWTGYPLDHDQQLPPNNDQPMAGRDAQHPSWVAGWLRLDTEAGDKTDSTNVTLLVGDSLAEYGSIGPYIGEPKVYRCVRDRSTVNIGGQVFARARTLAMNAYMNGKGIWNETNYATFRFLEEIKDPSGTWVLLEEREDSINDGYFAVRMSDQYVLIDTPANYHQNGCYFSFADGHVELKKWVEGTTSPPLVRGVHLPGLPHYTSFLDRDLQWVTSRTTWLK
jgi:prepilin-type processing-associated H-X9-DG protein